MIEGGASGGLIVESERDGRPTAVGGWDANIVEVDEVGVGHEKRTNVAPFEVVAVVPHAVFNVGVALEHAKYWILRRKRRAEVSVVTVYVRCPSTSTPAGAGSTRVANSSPLAMG